MIIMTVLGLFLSNERRSLHDYYAYGLEWNGNWKKVEINNIATNQRYNGKEHVDEMNSNLLFYGARLHMPDLGRFTTSDRFSDKFAFQSTYAYGAGNPIKFIDVNGDSIKIMLKNGNYAFYEKGRVINSDGSDYSGDGTQLKKDGTIKYKGFLNVAKKGLDNIYSGGSAGAELIEKLSATKFHTSINNGKTNQTVNSKVYWNSSITEGGLDNSGSTFRPAYIGLAHEMAHSLNYLQGTRDLSIWFTANGQNVTNAEKFASNFENRIRAEQGMDLRSYYTSSAYPGAELLIGGRAIYPSIFNLAPAPIPSIPIKQLSSNK